MLVLLAGSASTFHSYLSPSDLLISVVLDFGHIKSYLRVTGFGFVIRYILFGHLF